MSSKKRAFEYPTLNISTDVEMTPGDRDTLTIDDFFCNYGEKKDQMKQFMTQTKTIGLPNKQEEQFIDESAARFFPQNSSLNKTFQ